MKPTVCSWRECGREFVAQRSTAKFCSVTCRSRAARDRKAAEAAAKVSPSPEPEGPAEHKLVTEVRRELRQAGALDTVDGQIALQLARRVVEAGASGVSALSRELRAVLSEAKAAGAQPPGGDDADSDQAEAEDEVARARRLRQEAREAAGLT